MIRKRLSRINVRSIAVAALASVPILAVSAVASAATSPVTFGQVIEDSSNTNANVFTYNDNGSDAELGTDAGGVLGAPIAVDFTFLSILGTLPSDLAGTQDATLTMTSSTVSPVTTAMGGVLGDQPITGDGAVTDIIKITRDTPATEGNGARTNLLTMTFTGDLIGVLGGSTPQLSGNSTLGDVVTYSSDFVNFANPTTQNYSLTFSSWGPLTPPPPGLSVAADGFYNGATAAGTGTFDFAGSASVIPEPSMSLAEALGLVAILGFSQRRFRMKRATI